MSKNDRDQKDALEVDDSVSGKGKGLVILLYGKSYVIVASIHHYHHPSHHHLVSRNC